MDDLYERNAHSAEHGGNAAAHEAQRARAEERGSALEMADGQDACCRVALSLACDFAYCWRVEPDGAFSRQWATAPAEYNMPAKQQPQSVVDLRDIVHPDDVAQIETCVQRALAGEEVAPHEVRVVVDGGRTRWIRHHLRALTDSGGDTPTYLIGVAHDITAAKRDGCSVRTLLDTTPEMALLIDLEGRLLAANESFARGVGIPITELLGTSLLNLLPPDVAARRRARALEVIASGEQLSFEDEWDGRDYTNLICPLRDERNEVTRLAIYSRDVTAHRQWADAYLGLVDQSILGMAILQRGRMVFANRAIADLTGCAEKELASFAPEDLLEVVYPDDREAVRRDMSALLAGEALPRLAEFRVVHRDGSVRWLQVNASTIDYLGGPALDISCLDVTERRRAEADLRTAHADLEHAQRIARFGTWRWSAQSSETMWSEGMYRIYGLEPQQDPPHSDSWMKHVHPADREAVAAAIQDALDGTRNYDLVYRILRHCDGEERWLHTVGDVIRDDSGRALALVGTAHDMTEYFRTEAALADSELKFRSIVEQSPDGIVLTDEHGIIVEWNEAIERMSGISRRQALGKPIWEMQLAMLPAEQRVAHQLERFEAETRGVCASGTATWLGRIIEQEYERPERSRWIAQMHVSAVRFGERFTLLAISRDVTEQRRAQQELENRRIEMGQIQRTLPDALVYTDAERRIVQVNPAFTRIYGYEPDEVLGCDLSLLHAGTEQRLQQDELRRRVWAGESTSVQELEFARKDGTVFLGESLCTVLRDADDRITGFMHFVRDVSDRKKLGQQLAQAQKLEAIGQLAGGVAHDFNNILTAIMGFSDFLLRDLDRDDPRYEDLEAIRRSGERAVGLTRQLLTFSRRQMLQPRVLDLNGVISNMGRMLRRLISEDIEMSFTLAPNISPVKVDVGQVEQVLLNLVVNAREAMPFGGSITIRTDEADVDAGLQCFCGDVTPGRYVLLEIADTGQGMDEATLSHLFEPFFTTKETGTGLGLATVLGIVTQSKGHVTVSSAPGAGATFRIYLPCVDPAEAISRTDRSEAAGHGAGTETILLVEDADAVRDLACRILSSRGYTVLEAGNGEHALRVVAEHHGQIDLLVTDVVMPGGMSGRQLAERLVSACPGLRVLYMSGYTDEDIVQHGVLNSGSAFIEKPFTPTILLNKVRDVLDL